MGTQREQELEQALGQNIDMVNWRKRMKEGWLVTLTIKRWRARTKLTLNEIGIYPTTSEERAAYEQLLTLGSKLLLPVQTIRDLEAIERGARIHLGEHSFNTPFGTFIPYTSYKIWQKGNEDFKARFFAKRDEIVAEYETLVEQVMTEYEQIARRSYQLLRNQAPELAEMFPTEEAFLTHYREEVIGRNLKSAREIADSFVYEETFSRVSLLSSLSRETEEVSAEEVDETVSAKSAEIEAAQARKRQLEEMNREIVQKTREQKSAMVDSFLTSIVAQLRTLTYDAVTSVLASIKNQEHLRGRSVQQLQHLIKQLEGLNFYGDQDIDTILTLLHGIIKRPAKERNLAEITQHLRSVATLTRGTILALGEQPREGKEIAPEELGVILQPDDEDLREAREEIARAIQDIQVPDGVQEEEREEREEQLLPVGSSEEIRSERTEEQGSEFP